MRVLTLAAMLAAAAFPAFAQPDAAVPPLPTPASTPALPIAAGAQVAPVADAGPAVAPSGDIISTLRASGRFTVLLAGLQRTNLVGVLRNNHNLTLLAPTDEAFRALPPETLQALTAPRNAALFQRVLTYHLINAPVDGGDMRGARGRVVSVEGADLHVNGAGEGVLVEDGRLTQLNVRTSNGLIHVIDRVLIPSDVAALGVLPGVAARIGNTADVAATAISAPPPAPPAPPTAAVESLPTQPTATLGH